MFEYLPSHSTCALGWSLRFKGLMKPETTVMAAPFEGESVNVAVRWHVHWSTTSHYCIYYHCLHCYTQPSMPGGLWQYCRVLHQSVRVGVRLVGIASASRTSSVVVLPLCPKGHGRLASDRPMGTGPRQMQIEHEKKTRGAHGDTMMNHTTSLRHPNATRICRGLNSLNSD